LDVRLNCGATGNCWFWIFHQDGKNLRKIFDSGSFESLVITSESHEGFRDIALIAHESASEQSITFYQFRKGKYHEVKCFEANWMNPSNWSLMKQPAIREIDCVLVWKFDRFARSTRHLLAALEEFNHLGVRFVSVQNQIDTDSPMGRAMFTIIGAMAELESSLISERVTAAIRAAETRGKHLGRPSLPTLVTREIEELAATTNLSIRQIQTKIAGRASRGIIGEITKQARQVQTSSL